MLRKEQYLHDRVRGASVASIARKYGVSEGTVRGALKFDKKHKSHGYH